MPAARNLTNGCDVVSWYKLLLPWISLCDGPYCELWAKMKPEVFLIRIFFLSQWETMEDNPPGCGQSSWRFSSTWNKCIVCCCLVNQLDINYMLLIEGNAEFYNLTDSPHSHSPKWWKAIEIFSLSFPIHQPLLHAFYRSVLVRVCV